MGSAAAQAGAQQLSGPQRAAPVRTAPSVLGKLISSSLRDMSTVRTSLCPTNAHSRVCAVARARAASLWERRRRRRIDYLQDCQHQRRYERIQRLTGVECAAAWAPRADLGAGRRGACGAVDICEQWTTGDAMLTSVSTAWPLFCGGVGEGERAIGAEERTRGEKRREERRWGVMMDNGNEGPVIYSLGTTVYVRSAVK